MEPTRFTLCPHCTECPEVEFTTDQEVRIGEGDNSVHLSKDAWNELVRLIKAGQLREI
jgi:sarcosine oxidase delta subunit